MHQRRLIILQSQVAAVQVAMQVVAVVQVDTVRQTHFQSAQVLQLQSVQVAQVAQVQSAPTA